VAYCWGRDEERQLGNGDVLTADQESPTPVDVSGIPGNPALVQLTGGHDHACGIAADGAAYCWGSDAFGQLGNGDLLTDGQSVPSLVDSSAVAGNGAFVAISGGGVFTCGRTADGVAHCWGRDDSAGQLGNGPGVTVDQASPFRVDVSSILTPRSFTALSAAGDVTCGVTTGGGAYCWGFDGMGQLGNGAAVTDSQNTPSAIVTSGMAGNPVFVGVEASAYHTCGITASGAPYCWGQDSSAQLGNGGTLTDDQPEPSPVDTGGLAQNRAFVQVVTGYSHSCGLAADGRAYCWGADNSGQLGNGAVTGTQDTPSAVETSGLSNPAFIQLTAGMNHTCGLTADRTAYCWGSNSSGQLGGAGSGTSPVPVSTSGISGNPVFVLLRAGGDHTCGLTADGVAYCWGSDSYESLGNGSAGDASTPTPVDTAVITGDQTFVDLAPGRYHGCGRTADGITHCWGWDQWGQVGNGGVTGDQESPNPIDPSGITGSPVLLRLASGTAHTCAIGGSGVAHCWGRGTAGQLGNGSFSGALEPGPVVALSP
jgi:alpha-tubulin suppressor-like RCC1 family protein